MGGYRALPDSLAPPGYPTMTGYPTAPGSVDLPALAAAFGRALRAAGVPVTAERSASFARALALAQPHTREQLYWSGRVVLCSAHEQLEVFDRVFGVVFGATAQPPADRGEQHAPPSNSAMAAVHPPSRLPTPLASDRALARGLTRGELSAQTDVQETESALSERPLATASELERLAERDFATLAPDELRALRSLIEGLASSAPQRRSRRSRRDRRGARVDLRASLRAGARATGDPQRLVRRRRLERPRRLVAICDVSGSMEPYTRAYLQLLHAAVGGTRAEAFVFATRLTRITRALSARDADEALARAAAAVVDWSSGTRLGDALRRFNDEHGRRGMARGAVVLILSDGWERGDPALLEREMQRLSRLAHRIVWVNPRRAAPGFEPLAGGMAAALPYCDAFVSGHSAAALAEVMVAVRGSAR